MASDMTAAHKAFTWAVRIAVVAVWAFLLFAIVDWAGQQIEFSRSMGGLF